MELCLTELLQFVSMNYMEFCYTNVSNFILICFAGICMSYLQWSKKNENTGNSQAIVKVICSKLLSIQLTIEFSTKNT